MTRYRNILKVLVCGLPVAALLLTGCSDLFTDDVVDCTFDSRSYLTLTFVTPGEGTPAGAEAGKATRASNYEKDGYEDGIEYEDYIDFTNKDYKIYFFASMPENGTLIAEFEPTEITSTEGTAATDAMTYTLTGKVPDALLGVSNFRVVVLANWGEYLSDTDLTPGVTTIDDLCQEPTTTTESTYSTYDAMVSNGVATMTSMPDESGEGVKNLIPFFGVQEYTGVSFSTGKTTTLSTPVSLLRAVAKVEIIITAEGSVQELNDNGASIVNYNSRGYCAPWGVYTAEDYDTEMNYNPNSGNWGKEWIDGLHLVTKDSEGNGINDTDNSNPSSPKTILMYKVQEYATTDPDTGEPLTTPQLETWRAYVPEYNNMGTDYSYMTVTYGGDETTPGDAHYIYFAEYNAETGKTTAYGEEEGTDMPDRLNIKRNNLYRFYVTIEPFELRVYIDILPWVERLDDYDF